ncbi:hypothetical protein Taro_001253 [Colocasia esculenta]|uniref:Uncharacterized protein n=1 Tax=Colocasia esculenta TaxID=4460 RepID=A0A843TIL5_COLES|nr:hypothetical protein [Colocasia esculenta]
MTTEDLNMNTGGHMTTCGIFSRTSAGGPDRGGQNTDSRQRLSPRQLTGGVPREGPDWRRGGRRLGGLTGGPLWLAERGPPVRALTGAPPASGGGPPVRGADRRPSWLAEGVRRSGGLTGGPPGWLRGPPGAASQGPDWRPSWLAEGPPVRGLTGAPLCLAGGADWRPSLPGGGTDRCPSPSLVISERISGSFAGLSWHVRHTCAHMPACIRRAFDVRFCPSHVRLTSFSEGTCI